MCFIRSVSRRFIRSNLLICPLIGILNGFYFFPERDCAAREAHSSKCKRSPYLAFGPMGYQLFRGLESEHNFIGKIAVITRFVTAVSPPRFSDSRECGYLEALVVARFCKISAAVYSPNTDSVVNGGVSAVSVCEGSYTHQSLRDFPLVRSAFSGGPLVSFRA